MTDHEGVHVRYTNQRQPVVSIEDNDEPMVSIQSQIGLVITAVLTVLGFVFHDDFSDLAGPIGVIAFAIYGAAVALARSIKHRTVVVAQTEVAKINAGTQEFAPHGAVSQAFGAVDDDIADLQTRMARLEIAQRAPAKKTTAKKTTTRQRSRT